MDVERYKSWKEIGVKNIEKELKKEKKVEERLRESMERFKKLWENAPIACHTLNTRGIITSVNQTEARMLGYAKEEMVGKSIFEFILPDQRQEAWKRFQQKLAGKRLPRARDRIYVRKDGSKIYVTIDDKMERDSSRKIISIDTTMADITDLKEMEAVLKESEKRYKDLVEKAGIAILVDDKEGNFKYVNERYAEIFGYSVEEMKKQSIRSVVHPDDVERVIAYHRERLQGKKVPSRYDFKGIRKDGSIIYLEVDAVALREGEELVGTRSYLWDITEQKRAEEALRESEERFRSVVENSYEGILILDDNFKLIYCNDELCRMSGYSRKDIIGQDFRQFLDEESKALVTDRYIKRQRGEKVPSRYELNIVRKDGTKLRVEISSAVIKDAAGKVKTVAQILDITDRKRAEEEIQETIKTLRKALNGTINAIALTVEARDLFTSGHQRRVADLAQAIATEMRISKDSIEGIRSAGLIHDLGKICVPADILIKPSKLSESEWSMIRVHPQVAYDILKEIEFSWPVATIIYQHHERMNGSGYPQGLSDDNILLEARILAVADVVEAMVSRRPYRPSLGIENALKEISKNKGTLYDPAVVNTCLRLFREKRYTFK